MQLTSTIPVLRIFDEAKAREFYCEFLGFSSDWEHRFADNFPLYMQVSRDECVLHLTAHHGDCCPGAAVRIQLKDLVDLRDELHAKNYQYAKPAIEKTPWNTQEMSVKDPFGNTLIFVEPGPPET